MQKSFCGVHVDEEEKYLCIHPSCIKEKENKLLCGQCFDKHAQDRTEFHQKVSYYILLEKANTNKEAFTKLQESNIDRIQSIFEEFKKQLNQLVESIRIWQANQLKLLEDSAGTQIKQFQEELTKTNAYYKLDQLDNQIYFYYDQKNNNQVLTQFQQYLLDYPEQKRLSEESFKNTQRFISQKMNDYKQLTELLTQKNWNFQSIFQTSQGQYCLPKATQEDIIFEICKEHKEKKNQLFINPFIQKPEIGQLSCIKCLIKNNQNANLTSIRNVSDLIYEEKEKNTKQKEELLNFQQSLTTLIDQNLVLIEKKQKEYYEYFESFKTNILCIENEAIQKLMVTPKCDLIFLGLDFSKLFISHADVQRQFQNDMKGVEDKIKPISIVIEKPVDLFHQIQLEKTNKELTEQISQMQTTNSQLIEQVSQINKQLFRLITQIQTTNNQFSAQVSQIYTSNQQLSGFITQISTTNTQLTEKISQMEKQKSTFTGFPFQVPEIKNQSFRPPTIQNNYAPSFQIQTPDNKLYERTTQMQINTLSQQISQMQTATIQLPQQISQMQTANNQQSQYITYIKTTNNQLSEQISLILATNNQITELISCKQKTNNQLFGINSFSGIPQMPFQQLPKIQTTDIKFFENKPDIEKTNNQQGNLGQKNNVFSGFQQPPFQ